MIQSQSLQASGSVTGMLLLLHSSYFHSSPILYRKNTREFGMPWAIKTEGIVLEDSKVTEAVSEEISLGLNKRNLQKLYRSNSMPQGLAKLLKVS
eukprot:3701541-Ditylum_brightwellii.AAC.1